MAPSKKIKLSLEAQLLGLLRSFHQVNPNHPMFGSIDFALLRAPYKSVRSNGVSWIGIVAKIARRVRNPTTTIGDNKCWMAMVPQYKISKIPTPGAKPKAAFAFLITRFLCFLANPTDENWRILHRKDTAIGTPFSHFCSRGQPTAGQKGVCINGIEHGVFMTRAVNESMKCCKNGSRATCPGHAGHKCIFTHPDGELKKCLMHDNYVPACIQNPKCFPING